MNKHKSRQHARNEGHYKGQFTRTYQNQLRRVRQSSGMEAARRYTAEVYPEILKRAARLRKVVETK